MKREYVKPVIEGELFVANEYVAACYTMTCVKDCGSKNFTNLPYEDLVTMNNGIGPGVYYGILNTKGGCENNTNGKPFGDETFDNWYNERSNAGHNHPVAITSRANAS